VVDGLAMAACEMWTLKPSICWMVYWSVVSWMKVGFDGDSACCIVAQDARMAGASRRAIERVVRVGWGMRMGSGSDMC